MAPSLLAAWRVACYEVEKRYSFRFLDSVIGGMLALQASMADKGYPGKAQLIPSTDNLPGPFVPFCSLPINESGATILFIPDTPL